MYALDEIQGGWKHIFVPDPSTIYLLYDVGERSPPLPLTNYLYRHQIQNVRGEKIVWLIFRSFYFAHWWFIWSWFKWQRLSLLLINCIGRGLFWKVLILGPPPPTPRVLPASVGSPLPPTQIKKTLYFCVAPLVNVNCCFLRRKQKSTKNFYAERLY
jgi:hypothetical protein